MEHPFAPDRLYRRGDCPAAESAFDRWIIMNINEHYTERDIDEIALGVGKVAYHFAARRVFAANQRPPGSSSPAAE